MSRRTRETFLHDERGRLRGWRIALLVAILVLFTVVATLVGFVASGAGSSNAFGAVIVITLVAKLVLLTFLLRIFLRHAGAGTRGIEGEDEVRRVLAAIEQQASESVTLPDAARRLQFLRDEAWRLVDETSDAHRPAAVEAAVRVDRLRAQAAARERSGPPTRP